MTAKPTSKQFTELNRFLFGCQAAANPPPPRPVLGLAWRANHPAEALWRAHPRTLGDVMHACVELPFATEEQLPDERPARVAMLLGWLRQIPAFQWLSKEPNVEGALLSFERIKKRRLNNPTFSDDLAEIRFWTLVSWAPCSLTVPKLPPLTKDDRNWVVNAAKKLARLNREKTLARDARVSAADNKTFLALLEKLQKLQAIDRAVRNDGSRENRQLVQSLAAMSIEVFGDAPPALIVALAAMTDNNNYDKPAITKLITELKNRRASRR